MNDPTVSHGAELSLMALVRDLIGHRRSRRQAVQHSDGHWQSLPYLQSAACLGRAWRLA